MHYSYLAYISMVLSFILAIVQLYIWMKQVKTHSHLNSRLAKVTSVALLAIPIVVGLTFPTVSLDSQTVSAKGYHFPLSEGTDQAIQTSEGTTSQYLKPDTSSYFSKSAYEKEMRTAADKYLSQDSIQITNENYMEVMEAIYDYPDEFEGKTVQFTGFVYNDPSHANSQFLFRFGIIHCIADSGVYGLLTKEVPVNMKTTLGFQPKENWSITTIKNSNKISQPWKSIVLPKSINQRIPMFIACFKKANQVHKNSKQTEPDNS